MTVAQSIFGTILGFVPQAESPVPAERIVDATIPFWVWLVLLPVVLFLFWLSFRKRGPTRPISTARRLDQRPQPDDKHYRERIPPAFVKPRSPDSVETSGGDDRRTLPVPDRHVGAMRSLNQPASQWRDDLRLDVTGVEDVSWSIRAAAGSSFPDVTSAGQEAFSETQACSGFGSPSISKPDARSPSSAIVPNPGTFPGGERLVDIAAVESMELLELRRANERLASEVSHLRRELSGALRHMEDSLINDKLPELEMELVSLREELRQMAIREQLLARQLENGAARNRPFADESRQ
jgi:hypothetical protein